MADALLIAPQIASGSRLTDSHGRVIHDLRVSITDRYVDSCRLFLKRGHWRPIQSMSSLRV